MDDERLVTYTVTNRLCREMFAQPLSTMRRNVPELSPTMFMSPLEKRSLSQQHNIDAGAASQLTPEVSAALHKSLGDCPALAVAVQLEDLLMQRPQPNVPGTTDEQPNWRRKYTSTIEELITSDAFLKITTALRKTRPQ